MRERIRNILSAMAVGTYEREEVLALSLLSALSGESIFLLGLPGVGKSMVARRLKLAFKDATVFEYLMSRFSTPDEIFGRPISISKLKDADSYERVTAGYLPEAEVVFLDEIWKAGPAIQNSLLTVLNEKIFLNGNNEMHLPIKGVISASNELPAEREGLEALWDRFLLRYVVEPLKRKDSFTQLIGCGSKIDSPIIDNPITEADFQGIQAGIQSVSVPGQILELLCTLRDLLGKRAEKKKDDEEQDYEDIPPEKFYISDRRWKKAVGVLRASAFLNGRDSLNLSDVFLLKHMLWNEEPVIKIVEVMIAEEVMKILFRDLLKQFKSYKRHATKESADKRLYTPDREHYVVLCDGEHLNLKIGDYNKMKDSGQIYFGSEMSDGSICVKERGQFTIQVVKEGFVSINSYNYPLRTNADKQLSEDFLQDFGGNLEQIALDIYKEIDENLFLNGSECKELVYQFVNIYKKRIEG
ncbi:MAG: AAA family ATPase [Bacteroidales bacterium]|nr:AAA family ATPase [Bacteroidales bacterium]